MKKATSLSGGLFTATVSGGEMVETFASSVVVTISSQILRLSTLGFSSVVLKGIFMSLEIVNVVDRGLPGAEHVHLHVAQSCNLEFFTLVDTSYVSPGIISNKVRHHFWFPSTQVEKGDQVVVVTGKGFNRTIQRDGYRTHFFFWQLEHSIWNDDGDTAVIFALESWASKRVPPRGFRLAA